MTDRRRGLPHPVATFTVALVLFVGLMALLTWQVRSGQDPALGAGAPTPAPKQVLVKRLVRRVIDTKVVVVPPKEIAPAASPGAVTYASAPVAASAPAVGSAPAPAPVAAAPAPAPAPAPAVTQTS